MTRYRWGLVGFLALVTAFRLWYLQQGVLELSPDEAHYWEWSRRLDWSYYSKGPLVAYLIALSTRLGGSTEFFVRLPAVLLAAGTTILIFRLAKALFADERVALLASIVFNLTPVFAAFSLLMTIDSPLIFFWTLTLWFVYRGVAEERAAPWYWAGLALGCGLLAKYSAAFLVPSVFIYLATSARHRKWLSRKEPYLMLLLALAVFSPVLVWNAQRQAVSLKHVMAQAQVDKGLAAPLGFKTFVAFVGSQAVVLSPLVFAWILVAMGARLRPGSGGGDDRWAFLFWGWAPTFLTFLLLSLRQKVQANWATPAYLTALIAAVAHLSRQRPWAAGTGASRSGAVVIGLTAVLALAMTVAFHVPGTFARLGFAGAADPLARFKGWRALGTIVGARAAEMPSAPFLVSDRYQISSELAFYAPGQPRTYCFNLGRRLNQYDLWGGLSALAGRDAVYVQFEGSELAPVLRSAFGECGGGESVAIQEGDRELRRVHLFRCTRFSGVAPEPAAVDY